MPNGSGHSIGFNRARAPARSCALHALRRPLPRTRHVVVKQRPDTVVEVGHLGLLAHLGREHKRHVCGAGQLDGPVHALARVHPAEEQQVAADSIAERPVGDVDAVVHDAGQRHRRRRRGLVVGDGHYRGVARAAWAKIGVVSGVNGPWLVMMTGTRDRPASGPASVWSWITSARQRAACSYAHHHMGELGRRVTDRTDLSVVERRAGAGRAARCRGGRRSPPRGLRATRAADETVQHGLRPAVGRRRHGNPGSPDDRDPHGVQAFAARGTEASGGSGLREVV